MEQNTKEQKVRTKNKTINNRTDAKNESRKSLFSYVLHNKVYVSLPKTLDPMEITLEEAEQLILEKRQKETERHIKKFEEEPELEILNGRYGPYITYKGSNYKIPKDIVPQDLSLASCLELIKLQDEKGPATTKKGRFAKKK